MAKRRIGRRMRKRKTWKGKERPDRVVGTGRKGAIPVPRYCQYLIRRNGLIAEYGLDWTSSG